MASSTDAKDGLALRRAILASPDDDAPRLIYADWLLEQGDPRGTEIIGQCMIAQCQRAGDRTSMAYKAALAHLRPNMERGFMSELEIRPHEPHVPPDTPFLPGVALRRVRVDVGTRDVVWVADLARVRALAETTPIDTLELVCPHGRMAFDARAFFAALDRGFPPRAAVWGNDQVLPVLFFWDALTELELTDRSPPFDGLALAIPPNLRQLRMSAFAATPRLLRQVPRLERLEIYEATTDVAREVFAEWPFEKLEALTLVTRGSPPRAGRHLTLGRAVADACAEAGATKGLKHLDASFLLDHRMPLASLETLRMVGGPRGDLVSRLGPQLHRLVVHEADLVYDLADVPPPALSELELVECTINGDRAHRVAASVPLAQLGALTFTDCRHNFAPMRDILHSRTLAPIRRIFVSGALKNESRWRNDAWRPGTS